MEKTKKKSFADSYPFIHDVAVVAVGILVGGLLLTAVNTYVMPALTPAKTATA
jgi:hypothetical protein